VIDCATDSIIQTVALPRSLTALAWVPQADLLFGTGVSPDGGVVAIRGSTNQVVAWIPDGIAPAAIASNRAGTKVYVGNSGSSITVIDCATLVPLKVITLGAGPDRLVLDTIADRIYATSSSGGHVWVIDCTLDRQVIALPLEPGPYDMAWNAARRRMYVSDFDGASITVVRDTTVIGLAETQTVTGTRAMPTIVRGVLFLPCGSDFPVAMNRGLEASPTLLDITGRKVMSLRPGANDVSRLASGVYFVRFGPSAVGREALPMRKVVVQR